MIESYEEVHARALAFATNAHEGQFRKYTGEPYIVHPIEVSEIMRNALIARGLQPPIEMVVAALCHDVVEDCNVTFNTIHDQFGSLAAELVFWLTDSVPKTAGNRAMRKEMEARRVGRAPLQAQFIKLADFISNTTSIVAHDPGFAKVYLEEKMRVLGYIRQGPDVRAISQSMTPVSMAFNDLFMRAETQLANHRKV